MDELNTTQKDDQIGARVEHLEEQVAAGKRTDTAHKATEARLQGALDYVESIIDTVREPILVLDESLRVRTASQAFYDTFAVTPDKTIGKFVYDLGNGQSREAHFLASRVWRTYRQQGGKRIRILADFLIGAHAQKQASRLLSRDRGFYGKLFPSLDLRDPTKAKERENG